MFPLPHFDNTNPKIIKNTFSFVTNPNLDLFSNSKQVLSNMPKYEYESSTINATYHNLCPPSSIPDTDPLQNTGNLLGLGLKFVSNPLALQKQISIPVLIDLKEMSD